MVEEDMGLGELLSLVRKLAHEHKHKTEIIDVGTVLRVGEGVATISGLPRAMTDELVEFPNGVHGLILNLDHDWIDCILLGPDEGIQGGDLVTSLGRRVEVPVGEALLGRVVDPLGKPLDGKGPIRANRFRFIEREAPSVVDRRPVSRPLLTGIKAIDSLIPIGKGQRELIIGDRQTGKTAIAIDAIINQRGSDVVCVYVSIGQKKAAVKEVIRALEEHGAMEHTIVVVADPDDPPALSYLAPYAGCTMAEEFVYQGRDALIVYDDLSKHADSYRELSLLLRRPPGREAYPGDIFYLHSRLMERAGQFSEELGGGSLTTLAIGETKMGNIAAYIPTNLISMTDGQIYLDPDLFNLGFKPAIDVGLSVSRVGGQARGHEESLPETAPGAGAVPRGGKLRPLRHGGGRGHPQADRPGGAPAGGLQAKAIRPHAPGASNRHPLCRQRGLSGRSAAGGGGRLRGRPLALHRGGAPLHLSPPHGALGVGQGTGARSEGGD